MARQRQKAEPIVDSHSAGAIAIFRVQLIDCMGIYDGYKWALEVCLRGKKAGGVKVEGGVEGRRSKREGDVVINNFSSKTMERPSRSRVVEVAPYGRLVGWPDASQKVDQ
jgi:hypothetical protein